MLPITGYVDRWSVKPGETIRFMISVRGGGRYKARMARVFCGDPNPLGPGYREKTVSWTLEGEHAGQEQPIYPGSWIDVPDVTLPQSELGLVLSATIYPTRLAAGDQTVSNWNGPGGSITLGSGARGVYCRITTHDRVIEVATGVSLSERAWYDIACAYDPAAGVLRIAQMARKPGIQQHQAIEAFTLVEQAPRLEGGGSVTMAAYRYSAGGRASCRDHFNGKIEAPAFFSGTPSLRSVLAAQRSGVVLPEASLIAGWDFATRIETSSVEDYGPQRRDGLCINFPNRAVRGSSWNGSEFRWQDAPEQYAAIHFHDDDLGDLGWQPSLRFVVPPDWASGLYALNLQTRTADGVAHDNIVFFVRARQAGSQARVAFLAPTFSYTVYGNMQIPGRQAAIEARSRQWNALPFAPDGHPEYGLSPYNLHSDGSGVMISSLRRPMIDKRVNRIQLLDPSPEGSGVYWIAADSYVLDLLDRAGVPVEVITDHDLHSEGAELLSRYQVVLTGQHPEYYSMEMLDALEAFLGAGGRLMYLGGNGFYWKVVPHCTGSWALELRRAESGIRAWATEPGESYHAFDGTYGGLWRRLGRPPQAVVGVGFSAQGDYSGHPYSFLDAILDPRVSFMRAGIEEATQPGKTFGERGFMGGGAAGHELDRADIELGTPSHALIIGRAIVTAATYGPVNEERLTHEWPAPANELIRSDLTFFETPNGGAVFSVGSMNFIGALAVADYENLTATLFRNILRRFADPAPFSPPLQRPGD